MMPDGQMIPAYLLDEKYSQDQGEDRMHYPQLNQESFVKSEPDISDFYKEAQEEPSNELDAHNQSINKTHSYESEKESNEHGINRSFNEENVENLPSRKERHQSSEMSRDDLLSLLEKIVDKNQRNKNDN